MDKSNQVLYQATAAFNPFGGKKPEVRDFFDTHIKKIEILKDIEEINNILDIIKENGESIENLDANSIHKTYFDNSEIILFTVPFIKDISKTISIYSFRHLTLVIHTTNRELSENKSSFNVKTLDNNIAYSMDTSKIENNKLTKITNIKVYPNFIFNNFSKEVHDIQFNKRELITKEDCCRHSSSWNECFECTASDTGGIIILSVFNVIGLIAIGGSCIGSGSNATC